MVCCGLSCSAACGILVSQPGLEPVSPEWIKKMLYIHTMEYRPTIKRNVVLIHTTTWVKDENIMLKKNVKKRPHILLFHLYEMSRMGRYKETEIRLVVA